jgi:PAS domain S-box-containing protein
MLDAAGNLIYVKDLEGSYLACNEASERFIGLEEAEQIGKTDFDLFPREFAEAIREEDRAVMASGTERRVEERVTYPDATRVLFESRKAPLHGPDGTIAGVVGVSRDVTARRRAEEDRERMVQELTEALARVKALSGLRPVCAWCKKIRNDEGYWEQIGSYLAEHSKARGTHGMCPACMAKHFPEGP